MKKDLRNNEAKISFKGRLISAGYTPDETSVKEMLTFMGVSHDDAMVQEMIGYFLHNSIEINMSTLEDYLKGRQIISKVDMRKKK